MGVCIKNLVYIFDLDGTVIDSSACMEVAWAAVSERFDLSIPFYEYKKNIGYEFNDICERLKIDETLWGSVRKAYFSGTNENIDRIKLFPAFLEVLDEIRARGIFTGLITSKPPESTREVLRHLKLDFEVIITGGDSKRGKPHKEPFELFAKRLPDSLVHDSEFTYFGDALVDMQFAVNSNINFVHCDFPNGIYFPSNLRNTFPVIQNWRDALKLI